MSPAEVSPPFTPGGTGLDVSFAVRLPRATGAAGVARHVVKKHLGDLLAEDALADTLLVVSELVSDATLDGKGDIELRVVFDGERVTGDVTDEATRVTEQPRNHESEQVGGRRPDLVSRVADNWGLGEGSNRVWFEILADRHPLSVG